MKIFLSALESYPQVVEKLLENKVHMKYNLLSFYGITKGKYSVAERIRDNTDEILIDSGAHSFQKGARVDWLEYTKQYAEFITKYDRPNVVGFFEMDVDNVIGYDKVLELRKVLETVSNKIIPVWHKNRGIESLRRCVKTTLVRLLL